MAPRLTAGQLVALTKLHTFGRLSPIGGGRGYRPHRVMSTTVDALVSAGVAARVDGTEAVRETVRAYADAWGIWNVYVPATVHPADRAAVARAVIKGETHARGESYYRPRVVLIGTMQMPGTDFVFYHYQEV